MKITEIERLPAGDYPGDEFDDDEMRRDKALLRRSKYVPGHKGFFWTVANIYDTKSIVILNSEHIYPKDWYDENSDQQTSKVAPAIIAQLGLEDKVNIPGAKMYQVGTIAVRKEYRGRGLGTALYLIALQQLKLWLMAGDSQTPGGRHAWISLHSIPGVEVDGLFMVSKDELNNPYRWGSDPDAVRRFDALVDQLMAIGFNHIGDASGYHCFLFPVKRGKGELMAAVRKAKFKLYQGWQGGDGHWDEDVSLIARWTGK